MLDIAPEEFFTQYIAFRADPLMDTDTDGMFAARNNVKLTVLLAWKSAHPEWAQQVLDLRRKRYAEVLVNVDKALIKKANEGDTKAAALIYARFEGWTPRTAEADAKRNPTNKTFSELIAEDEDG